MNNLRFSTHIGEVEMLSGQYELYSTVFEFRSEELRFAVNVGNKPKLWFMFPDVLRCLDREHSGSISKTFYGKVDEEYRKASTIKFRYTNGYKTTIPNMNLLTFQGVKQFARGSGIGCGKQLIAFLETIKPDLEVLLQKAENIGLLDRAEKIEPVVEVESMENAVENAEVSVCSELVPVSEEQIGNDLVQTCNARELWTFMESKQKYADWIKLKLSKTRAVEGKHYVRFRKVRKTNNKPLIEYHITLDIAKHFAMLENTDRGFQVREYFIEVEKAWRRGELSPESKNKAPHSNLSDHDSRMMEMLSETLRQQSYLISSVVENQKAITENNRAIVELLRENANRANNTSSTLGNKSLDAMLGDLFPKDMLKS